MNSIAGYFRFVSYNIVPFDSLVGSQSLILFFLFLFHFRTKWKRQTAVGLELLAEAGNYSALQRMFPSPYFYHPSLLTNMDTTAAAAMYMYRTPPPHPGLQRPLVPRVLIHGLGPAGQPALNPLASPISGTAHPR